MVSISFFVPNDIDMKTVSMLFDKIRDSLIVRSGLIISIDGVHLCTHSIFNAVYVCNGRRGEKCQKEMKVLEREKNARRWRRRR